MPFLLGVLLTSAALKLGNPVDFALQSLGFKGSGLRVTVPIGQPVPPQQPNTARTISYYEVGKLALMLGALLLTYKTIKGVLS